MVPTSVPDRLLAPAEVRPDVSSALATSSTDETRLKIGKPNMIRPLIGAGSHRMAALVIRARTPRTPDSHIWPKVIFWGLGIPIPRADGTHPPVR